MKLTYRTKEKCCITFGALFIALLWGFATLWIVLESPAYRFATLVTGGMCCGFCLVVLLGTVLCETSDKDEL